MTRKHVISVTQKENLEMSRQGGLDATDSLQEAFQAALKRHGAKARMDFVPYGRYTILDV
jgi:hypothetical protein